MHLSGIVRFTIESSANQSLVEYGRCLVVCTTPVGSNVTTIELQRYLWEKTVGRLKRHRAKVDRPPFRTKYRIACQLLVDLKPLLPKGWQCMGNSTGSIISK